jgi:hypothetical protein
MNAKTAAHLDHLLRASQAKARVSALPDGSRYQYVKMHPDIAAACFAAIDRQRERATALEIQAAAKERRQTDMGWDPWSAKTGNYIGMDTVQERAYGLALPEMQAIAEAHNAAALERYEAYRLACEQGVAVPPAEEREVSR